jgi:plastocyanin
MGRTIAKRLMGLLFLAAAAVAPAGAQQSGGPREFTVQMDNMSFGRLPQGAKVGDTIIWVNNDTVQHTVTARDGSFDVRLQPGKRGRSVLSKGGNIAIYCIFHPMMRATLRVAAS